MSKSTKNNTSKSTYPTRVPFRSKDTPINFGELYRNTQGEVFKLISRAAMYDNPEEYYLLLPFQTFLAQLHMQDIHLEA